MKFELFLRYLRNPYYIPEPQKLKFRDMIRYCILSLILIYLFSLLYSLIILFPLKYFDLIPHKKELDPTIKHILYFAIIGPLVEEAMFRGILRLIIPVPSIVWLELATFLLPLNKFTSISSCTSLSLLRSEIDIDSTLPLCRISGKIAI